MLTEMTRLGCGVPEVLCSSRLTPGDMGLRGATFRSSGAPAGGRVRALLSRATLSPGKAPILAPSQQVR